MKSYSGVFTALITPFKQDKIDELALRELIEWQISSKIDGLVLFGTTGEAPTITQEEYGKILNIAQEINNNRTKIIIGVSSNSTANVIEKIREFSHLADCVLVSTPYYNKPTQEGIYLHFKEIYERTNFPVIVYDIPGRCSVAIKDETMLRIMALPNIVAIKDATGSTTRPLILKHPKIALLSGDDITSLAYYVSGGDGTISVTSNVFPEQCINLYKEFLANNITEAMKINEKLFAFNNAMFIETNPIPIKYALSLLKKDLIAEYRLPLTQPTDIAKNIIENTFKKVMSAVI